MSDPVDPTTTAAWAELTELKAALEPDLRGWFAADPGRVESSPSRRATCTSTCPRTWSTLTSWPPWSGWPSRSTCRSAERRCSPASTSTSPRTGRCCTRRCASRAGRRPRGRRRRGGRRGARGADQGVRVRRQGAQRRVDRGHRGTDRDGGQHRHRRLRPGPGDGVRGAQALREAGARGAVRLQHRSDRRRREDQRPEPGHHLVHRRVQDVHHAGDPDQRPDGPRLAAGWAALGGGHPRGRGRRPGRRGQALRRRVDRPGQGGRVRHRPGERVRLLGLGRRPLLGGLRDRHQRRRGDRTGELRRLPGGFPCHRRTLREHAAGRERTGADGAAQRLVRQLLRRPNPRRAAVRAVSAPLRRVSPAADHGVQRQERALGRVPGDHAGPARCSGESRGPTGSTRSTS